MKTAVCFDFDGTLGDTETPAMEVAFWEVAAYLPDLPLGREGGRGGRREGGREGGRGGRLKAGQHSCDVFRHGILLALRTALRLSLP